ncbi:MULTISPECIES: DUF4268 domain-containing protein [unclassified Ensifer]|uniref:DUF4268 domain-containing protein n=1 Tax=unclassified Ensifer TaxID=2633371 RepID=UPI000715743F|nr:MULTISPECIES: DUF4268 domain-containing protein [unclassified Ensifer]KQX40916.1 hypothetical protein ASD49_15765 [Ensifer sp. Root1298]KQX70237.1 hypothetical protein ASD41_16840 [Ensifer sp. Root1312]KRC14477.1 hypothetical protein ASE29_17320 [Ensifer sp. Root74]KRD57015.1 hypothetical protein ASE71_10735 [Ensifer sp. Root954]
MNQHATPLLLSADDKAEVLRRIPLTDSEVGVRYDEAFVEDLLFKQPSALPIREIDSTYSHPVPICTQLSTRVGSLDVLYVTPEGRLVIVEAKLWRNPEARRKVVAQIIDYAAELARWAYTDLEREVAKRRGLTSDTLFSLVRAKHPNIDEAEFVDNVSKSLRQGRFLLLICGDGIREELTSIAEFLDRSTTLDLTFGLVELAIYGTSDRRQLVLPRVLAKTVTIRRQVLRIESNNYSVIEEEDAEEPEQRLSAEQVVYVQFWKDLERAMALDDASQPPITVAKAANTSLRMPSPSAWVTLDFLKNPRLMRVFLAFNRGEPGDSFYNRLTTERDQIEAELPSGTTWESKDGRHRVAISSQYSDLSDDNERQRAIRWFSLTANQFVNVFRPRLARYLAEL